MTALSLLNPESNSANSTTSYCLNLQSFFFLHVGTRAPRRRRRVAQYLPQKWESVMFSVPGTIKY